MLNMVYGSWDTWIVDNNQTDVYRRYEHRAIVDLLRLGYLCTGLATYSEKIETLRDKVSLEQAKASCARKKELLKMDWSSDEVDLARLVDRENQTCTRLTYHNDFCHYWTL